MINSELKLEVIWFSFVYWVISTALVAILDSGSPYENLSNYDTIELCLCI